MVQCPMAKIGPPVALARALLQQGTTVLQRDGNPVRKICPKQVPMSCIGYRPCIRAMFLGPLNWALPRLHNIYTAGAYIDINICYEMRWWQMRIPLILCLPFGGWHVGTGRHYTATMECRPALIWSSSRSCVLQLPTIFGATRQQVQLPCQAVWARGNCMNRVLKKACASSIFARKTWIQMLHMLPTRCGTRGVVATCFQVRDIIEPTPRVCQQTKRRTTNRH